MSWTTLQSGALGMTGRPSAGATRVATVCSATAAVRQGPQVPPALRGPMRQAVRSRRDQVRPPAMRTPRARPAGSPSWWRSSGWTGALLQPSCCPATRWPRRASSLSTSCASSWARGAGSTPAASPASGTWSAPPSRTRWARRRRPWCPCCGGSGVARRSTGARPRRRSRSARGPHGSARTAPRSASRACLSSSIAWSRWPRSGSTRRPTRPTRGSPWGTSVGTAPP
mmetsp:Transcript_5768/g.11681  ORF Transcript_5768/g.11681 Transcript_5768/m.11681 type:complete len:227 (-) Transcript_5768:204-884(-)